MDPNKLLDLITSRSTKDPEDLANSNSTSKLKFLRSQRLSLDSRIDFQQIHALRESSDSDYKAQTNHRHSFDLGFFKSWRRGSLPTAKRRSLRFKKKLSRQCESSDAIIPEEDIVIDHRQATHHLQFQRHSLDLFDLPSAIIQLRKSFKAIR